jgi:hypothetical protein
LFLLLFTVVALPADEPNPIFSQGFANGVFWQTLSGREKTLFITGMWSEGPVITLFGLTGHSECGTLVNQDWAPHITNGGLLAEIDSFYHSNKANLSLPVSMAVIYIYMRLEGSTEAGLEKFRSAALEEYPATK